MKNKYGQTALVLVLLSAAALIFLSVTLNWGRIAQTKALISIAADQGASLLASEVASYGEQQKQTYLHDTNQVVAQTGILMAIIMVIVSIIIIIVSWGSMTAGVIAMNTTVLALEAVAIGMAVLSLVLQVTVLQPGITALWNKLQKDQPVQQQFFEQGLSTALQSSVTDQVNITDYFDSNTNGIYGTTNGVPNDSISRFAVYYTERLKMLNQLEPLIPQVVLFYNQLGELMNGETCDQNANDVSLNLGIAPNPACAAFDCVNDPIDPACQAKIPNGFQLNDACTSSNPANTSTYNPYCDPCCQSSGRPANCPADVTAECQTNNPFGEGYLYLYDPAFQNNYTTGGQSFLDQFGRDQQMGPFSSLTPEVMSPPGVTPVSEFPNGVYPFFWLMNNYSPQVDNINPGSSLPSSQVHWCAAGGSIPSSGNTPAGFLDLAQLNLAQSAPNNYTCQGPDCCVNYLANNLMNVGGVLTPSGSGTTNGAIDMVGDPSLSGNVPNPALDPSFGEGGSGSWLPGDNQMCSASWPYNGGNGFATDGTCEWTGSTAAPTSLTSASTVDGLDDTMHALSDFVDFAYVLLSNDVQTLSSTFQTWYPQAAGWIAPGGGQCDDNSACTGGQCSDGSTCGASANGRLLALPAALSQWNTVITNWMNNNYASANAWCIPPQNDASMNANGSPTAESAAIAAGGTWGNLSSVIACLNYNATTAVSNYQACLAALPTATCPSSLPAACAASTLGRSLAGPAPAYDGCAGSYAAWVNNSLALATDEAPKFALRAAFLTDVSGRAQTMQSIFPQAAGTIQNFLNVPAAQLAAAYNQGVSGPSQSGGLPNSVIYGWVDNNHNGLRGYAHIVKVTAYSPGRGGNNGLGIGSLLPWIQTKTSGFLGMTRSYTLVNRDGLVYVSVKRWDEDHNPILFPNGHTLWQLLFHNPGGVTTVGQDLMQACNGLNVTGAGGSISSAIGFGLLPQTVTGLGYAGISTQDQTSLAGSFMLNDRGDGNVDPSAGSASGSSAAYNSCLSKVNALLANGQESHICAQYIASRNASGSSGNGDSDYSLKFVNCGGQPEDLGSS